MKKTYQQPQICTTAFIPKATLLSGSVKGWDDDDTAPINPNPGGANDFAANSRRDSWGDLWKE